MPVFVSALLLFRDENLGTNLKSRLEIAMGRKRVSVADIVDRLGDRPIELVEYAGSVVKQSTWRCMVDGCGHVWMGTADNITRGRSCPKCTGHIRVTLEIAVERLAGRGITIVDYCGEANGISRFRCDVDGHEWSTSFTSVESSGRGCPKCKWDSSSVSETEARARLDGRNIELVYYGGRSSSRSIFRCTKPGCGYEWETTMRVVHDEGCGCKKCAGLLKLTASDVALRLVGRDIELVSYAGTTAGMSTFRCTIDGHEWQTTATSVVSNKQGCAVCAGNIPYSLEKASDVARSCGCEIVEWGFGVNQRTLFRCLSDGYEWWSTLANIRVRSGCPRCLGREELSEEEVRAMLRVYPVDMLEYSGDLSGTSVFRCTSPGCGHIRETSVGEILRGARCVKCMGQLPIAEDEIIRRLGERPITLASYGGTLMSPSEWLCEICGRTWVAPADRVVGSGCGCAACAEYGFNPNNDGFFYAYRIGVAGTEYLGFGITGHKKRRHYDHKRNIKKAGATAELLFSYKTTGELAQSLERTIKQSFPIVDTGIPGFRTEAVEYSEKLLLEIKQRAEEAHKVYVDAIASARNMPQTA